MGRRWKAEGRDAGESVVTAYCWFVSAPWRAALGIGSFLCWRPCSRWAERVWADSLLRVSKWPCCRGRWGPVCSWRRAAGYRRCGSGCLWFWRCDGQGGWRRQSGWKDWGQWRPLPGRRWRHTRWRNCFRWAHRWPGLTRTSTLAPCSLQARSASCILTVWFS